MVGTRKLALVISLLLAMTRTSSSKHQHGYTPHRKIPKETRIVLLPGLYPHHESCT